MQDRDQFLRKFTSVELVGGCASHGCGVDRPDLIHVFCVRTVFETKRTEKSIIPESAKGQSKVQASGTWVPLFNSTILAIHGSGVARAQSCVEDHSRRAGFSTSLDTFSST